MPTEAEKDTERINFLEEKADQDEVELFMSPSYREVIFRGGDRFSEKTIRQAIDAAMKADAHQGE